MPGRLGNEHDCLFRALLQRPDLINELIRSFLPQEFARQTADRLIERMADSFIDDELRLHQCDGVYRMLARNGNEPDIVFILEHKSFHDPALAVQIGRYTARILNWYEQEEVASRATFPLIMPILIYHGKHPWKGPLTHLGISPVPKEIARFLVRIGFVLLDLLATRTEDLAWHPELRSVLAALKHSRDVFLTDDILQLILSGLREGTA